MSETSISAQRWLAKKAARMAVGGLSHLTGRLRTDRGPAVRILTYHRFGTGARMPFTVSAEEFDAQMAYLQATGKAVSLADVEAFLRGERLLQDGSVLVTIDDGDPSVLDLALPILKAHAVPAVVYALAGTPEGFSVMTPGQLRELHDNGIAVGSHAVTHRSLGLLSLDEATREARQSKERIEDWVSVPVTSFAYPYGTRADFSAAIAARLSELGYITGFTSQHGSIGPGGAGLDPLMLPRIKVESGDPAWLFPRLCEGGLDAWRLIDRGLSGLQKPTGAV